MPEYDEIDPRYGVPKKDIACPGCGLRYGARGKKACSDCEECTECCTCPAPSLIGGAEMIRRIVEQWVHPPYEGDEDNGSS